MSRQTLGKWIEYEQIDKIWSRRQNWVISILSSGKTLDKHLEYDQADTIKSNTIWSNRFKRNQSISQANKQMVIKKY